MNRNKLFFLYFFALSSYIQGQIPHTFTIKKNGQLLVFAGMHHTCNPNNAQYESLKQKWSDFLKTSNPNKILLFEHATPIYNALLTQEEVIRTQSDNGFAAHLAHKSNIPCIPADIDYPDQVKLLLKEYPKEAVYLWLFCILMTHWHTLRLKPVCDNYVMQRMHSWTNDTSLTFAHMQELHKICLGKDFDKNNQSFFANVTSSTQDNCFLNKISKRIGAIRDAHIIAQIKKYWADGKSIFVVFGANHAQAQEAQLKKELTKK